MPYTRLVAPCIRYLAEQEQGNPILPGLSVLRRESESEIEAYLYEPVICLILQGAKAVSIGDQTVAIPAGEALLVSHHLPVTSRITRAPYLALILTLDPGLVRSLYDQIAGAPLPDAPIRPLAAGPADPAWLAPLERYLALTDHPLDTAVLGPSVYREVHYRLLFTPIGRMMRDLVVADSHASRIARAIHRLRAGFRAPLSVGELARSAGMSASSFHAHFRAVTGTTPLQYQKDLRLITARGLIAGQGHSVSQAAFAVGYQSPTHFSRDFARKFGRPPSREAAGSITGA